LGKLGCTVLGLTCNKPPALGKLSRSSARHITDETSTAVISENRMAAKRRTLRLERLDDRLTPAGLDPTFGLNGLKTLDLGAYETVSQVAADPDGKIVALAAFGDSSIGLQQSVLVRMRADGTLDPEFDGDGIANVAAAPTFGYLGNEHLPTQFRRLSSGQYLVASRLVDSTGTADVSYRLTLTRYNANGTLDTAYGPDGTKTVKLGTSTTQNSTIHIRADGSVLVAGYAVTPPPGSASPLPENTFATVRRIAADGTPDTAFGTAGTLRVDIVGANPYVRIDEGPLGQMLVSGTAYDYERPTSVSCRGILTCSWSRSTTPAALAPAVTASS
jgi:uncharacterized delta-60 repeat protein